THASAPPAAAPSSAPVRLAAATEPVPAIVVTGRRPVRAAATRAAARLKAEPASFESAEAPASLPSTLASMTVMLRRLPKSAVAPRAAHRGFASAQAVPQPAQGEVVGFGQVHAEAHLFTVRQALSDEQVAEIRRAVIQAAAEGRKVKLRVDRGDTPSGGGGQGHGFDINIQTLVKGE
ncbi:MAG: hypothetical protein ACXWU6_08340, partial [Allosphingosinicella sp.]